MIPQKPQSILRLVDVDKEFAEPSGMLQVLRKVHLSVRHGEIVIITGPSGSGKTTLLQISGGLIRPTFGRVEIAGTELGQSGEAQRLEVRRKHLGFVFQSFHLLAALTVYENVALGLRLRRLPIDTARIDRLLDTLGIASKARKFPQHLSGGEKQRVAIARALVGTPDLLLADEPTSQLDSNSAEVVGQLLRQAAHEMNVAVIITTHDPRLGDVADRRVTIKSGVLHA
jgi:putative ABC transport system ATP-binding protein